MLDDNKKLSAVKKRQEKEKELILEQLKQTPIIQIACQKINLGRATFYRWKNEDTNFAEAVNKALDEGNLFINDLSESQLIGLIKDGNLSAINLWLKTHHRKYATRVEVMAKVQHENQELTPEQKIIVDKALNLATLHIESGEKKG